MGSILASPDGKAFYTLFKATQSEAIPIGLKRSLTWAASVFFAIFPSFPVAQLCLVADLLGGPWFGCKSSRRPLSSLKATPSNNRECHD